MTNFHIGFDRVRRGEDKHYCPSCCHRRVDIDYSTVVADDHQDAAGCNDRNDAGADRNQGCSAELEVEEPVHRQVALVYRQDAEELLQA